MVYKTVVIDYAAKAKKMAAAIEEKANELARAGWELVTFSVTGSARAVLVFRAPTDAAQAESAPGDGAQEDAPRAGNAAAPGEAE